MYKFTKKHGKEGEATNREKSSFSNSYPTLQPVLFRVSILVFVLLILYFCFLHTLLPLRLFPPDFLIFIYIFEMSEHLSLGCTIEVQNHMKEIEAKVGNSET